MLRFFTFLVDLITGHRQDTTSFNFLELPLELRYEVYSNIRLTKDAISEYKGFFLSCKTVYHEATDEVIKNARNDLRLIQAKISRPNAPFDSLALSLPHRHAGLSILSVVLPSIPPWHLWPERQPQVYRDFFNLASTLHFRQLNVTIDRSRVSSQISISETQRLHQKYPDKPTFELHLKGNTTMDEHAKTISFSFQNDRFQYLVALGLIMESRLLRAGHKCHIVWTHDCIVKCRSYYREPFFSWLFERQNIRGLGPQET